MSSNRVLVTGSSRGIGRAIALHLARDGYEVIIHCRHQRDQAEAVQKQIQEAGGIHDYFSVCCCAFLHYCTAIFLPMPGINLFRFSRYVHNHY